MYERSSHLKEEVEAEWYLRCTLAVKRFYFQVNEAHSGETVETGVENVYAETGKSGSQVLGATRASTHTSVGISGPITQEVFNKQPQQQQSSGALTQNPLTLIGVVTAQVPSDSCADLFRTHYSNISETGEYLSETGEYLSETGEFISETGEYPTEGSSGFPHASNFVAQLDSSSASASASAASEPTASHPSAASLVGSKRGSNNNSVTFVTTVGPIVGPLTDDTDMSTDALHTLYTQHDTTYEPSTYQDYLPGADGADSAESSSEYWISRQPVCKTCARGAWPADSQGSGYSQGNGKNDERTLTTQEQQNRNSVDAIDSIESIDFSSAFDRLYEADGGALAMEAIDDLITALQVRINLVLTQTILVQAQY